MDTKLRQLNRSLKAHDDQLFARRESTDMIIVYRRGIAWQSCELNGTPLLFSIPSPRFIFALTDNWTVSGKPVDYGVEVVMARLRAIDAWNREDIADELINEYEKARLSGINNQKNNLESFLYDFMDRNKKAFGEVNTSNLKES